MCDLFMQVICVFVVCIPVWSESKISFWKAYFINVIYVHIEGLKTSDASFMCHLFSYVSFIFLCVIYFLILYELIM